MTDSDKIQTLPLPFLERMKEMLEMIMMLS